MTAGPQVSGIKTVYTWTQNTTEGLFVGKGGSPDRTRSFKRVKLVLWIISEKGGHQMRGLGGWGKNNNKHGTPLNK